MIRLTFLATAVAETSHGLSRQIDDKVPQARPNSIKEHVQINQMVGVNETLLACAFLDQKLY